MSIRHILFDLDGTLLPMIQDEFVKFYMPLLARAYMAEGVRIDTGKFISAVWAGYEAMVKNDGSRTNREAFWSYIEPELPIDSEASERIALAFYEKDFNQAICTTSPTPLAAQIVKAVREKGLDAYLATNPVFPRIATLNRIRWAGLDVEDFRAVTTYEACRYCKPHPEYYREILNEYSLDPSECLMVGNDVGEDLSVRTLGVKTFLVTDTMENRKNLPIETEYKGSLKDLYEFIGTL